MISRFDNYFAKQINFARNISYTDIMYIMSHNAQKNNYAQANLNALIGIVRRIWEVQKKTRFRGLVDLPVLKRRDIRLLYVIYVKDVQISHTSV